jgi:xanthine dehydrogenase small subunit
MRDSIRIYVNGTKYDVRGQQAFSSLASFLRRDLGLTGTKTACLEGGCGSCSVLLGRPARGLLEYRTINSCIQFLCQLDSTHVVTIEGLTPGRQLDVVQDAIVRCHGTQCGYCTPGFVISLTALCENARARGSALLNMDTLRRGLVGNLCRCTGYLQILEAGNSIDPRACMPLSERFAEKQIVEDLEEQLAIEAQLEISSGGQRRVLYIPCDLDAALAFLEKVPRARVVGGATNLGVGWSTGNCDTEALLSLSHVPGLDSITVEDGVLVLGASVTWARVETAVRDLVPEFHRLLDRFGSPQIRNVGTVAGNLVNASPLADSLPFLYVSGAEIVLVSAQGRRCVAIEIFYKDGRTALASTELVHSIRIPLPSSDDCLRLYKVSKRRHMDIATVSAAILVKRAGNSIREARLAYGGVGPAVIRLPKAESFLAGRSFDEESFRQAGRIASAEITPASDVHGSSEFRRELAGALPLKFYFEHCGRDGL